MIFLRRHRSLIQKHNLEIQLLHLLTHYLNWNLDLFLYLCLHQVNLGQAVQPGLLLDLETHPFLMARQWNPQMFLYQTVLDHKQLELVVTLFLQETVHHQQTHVLDNKLHQLNGVQHALNLQLHLLERVVHLEKNFGKLGGNRNPPHLALLKILIIILTKMNR